MKNKLFNFSHDMNMSESDFNEAMEGLIHKGFAEKILIDDKQYFQLTPMGELMNKHLSRTSVPEILS